MANINLDRVGWQDGTLISKAKVEIDGTIYDVEPEQYSGQTPLSSANLKKMEDNTENAINELNTNLNDRITNLSTYSTEEIKTGETWIDGKPIYRKSFTTTINASTHKVEIDVSDLNIERGLFDFNNSYINNTKHSRYMPIVTTNVSIASVAEAHSSSQTCMYYEYGYTKFVVEIGNTFTGGVFVTIRYTKTTD